jgi:hypothetical protein
MSRPVSAAARASLRRRSLTGIVLLAVLAGCGTSSPSPIASGSALPSASGSSAPTATAAPSAPISPVPLPTPLFTNPPDPELAALIPARVAGRTVEVPPSTEFAITPGDIASAYGELGLRFTALQVAYVGEPRLSLYAVRVSEPFPTTRQLEPYLETAGQYVGIAGLQREPWRYQRLAGRVTWVRPEDDATAAGTMIYTWAADGYVFLMIGVDDRLNRALFAELPGELTAPTPSATSPAQASPSGTEASASP